VLAFCALILWAEARFIFYLALATILGGTILGGVAFRALKKARWL